MLKQQSPSRARLAMGVASVAALCLGGGFAAWAAQPAQIAIQPAAEPQTTQQPSMVTVTSAPSDEVVVYQPSRATSGAAARPAQPAQPSAVQMSAQTSPAVSLDEQDPHVRTIVGRKLKVVQTATLDGDTFVATGISHEGNPAGVRVTVTRVPISAEEAQALASAGSSSTSNIFVAAGERAGSAPTSEFFAATPAPSAP